MFIFGQDLQNTAFRTSLTNVWFLYVNVCLKLDQSGKVITLLKGVSHNSVCLPIISFKLRGQLTQSLITRTYEINHFIAFTTFCSHFF